MPDQYQTVILTLDDGRKGYFTGRALVRTDDLNRRIVKTEFTKPSDLPEGCAFGPIDDTHLPAHQTTDAADGQQTQRDEP